MSKPTASCAYCLDKGWRWGRAAASLGQKGYATKKPCAYCKAGEAFKAKHNTKLKS
jgi:hypothetical protein